ncbi:MAG: DUF5060 domain-containing protein [Armatimonadetes bacterium]|nr:DUF5060 domain-containing protein [Armatimonadota bacterium]
MRLPYGLGAITFLFLLCLALPSHAQTTVPRDGRFEASWTLPGQTGNPYDPAQNDVQAAFHGPGGRAVRVPAFWDGDRWRVRYAPTQTGRYALAVLRNGLPIRPAGLTATAFRCVASSSPGFVRRDRAHVQRFVFDDGRAYYPFGMDQAWGGGGLPDYPHTFQTMRANGLNWARVWMTFWDNKALEWDPDRTKNPPIGQYDLTAARNWDTIMDAAERTGIYVQMTLQHHGQYTNQTDPNWRDNPFNAANGGFLQRPEDFFTNAQARRLTRAKYRYIVARWGYSTHLMAFELFNEVQNIGEVRPHFQDVVAWHKEMAAYIRSIDPNHHLITTSNSPPGDPLAKIGLDYDQIHTYVPNILSYFTGLSVAGVSVPVFLGEWGENGRQTQAALHDGLWSGIMVPTAGAPEYWYWDQVQRQGWWPVFHAVSRYVAASGMADQMDLRPVQARVTAAAGRADLSFTPSGGWGPTTSSDITAAPDGTITGLSGVSSFIQGRNNRKLMPKPLTIHLRCEKPCRFEVQIDTVSRGGAHPQLLVDGTRVSEKDYPAAEPTAAREQRVSDTLSADLTPGTHAVTLSNTGADWFVARRLTITDYAPSLAVLAKGNSQSAFFWAYNRDRGGTRPTSGTISVPGLAPGRYAVHLWNTEIGQPLKAPARARVVNGRLTVTLPPFAKDIAGYAIHP